MFNTDLEADLAAGLGNHYQVTTTAHGWIEVHLNPANALSDKLDFARIVSDDATHRLVHLTHNEVCKGEVTFTGSMAAYLPAVVREFCETQF